MHKKLSVFSKKKVSPIIYSALRYNLRMNAFCIEGLHIESVGSNQQKLVEVNVTHPVGVDELDKMTQRPRFH